ncbi:MAG: S8 family serine peptidase [Myxococcota bacterium]
MPKSYLSLAFALGLASIGHAEPPGSARYIVQARHGASAKHLATTAGGSVALELPAHNAVAVWLPEAAANALARNPQVLLVEADAKRYPSAETMPYGIPMVEANAAVFATNSASAAGVTVCIIDSGYAIAHPDLAGNSNVTWSTDAGSGNPTVDGCGHGTHVAGTVAAVGGNDTGVIGVNPSGDINLHIVKVFGTETEGECGWSYSSSLVAALGKCEAAGSQIVSMSLGGSVKSRFEEGAFNDANARGVLSIAAAGNDGSTRKSYPASYSSVMSVAAIDSNKVVADFSQKNDQVELAAPGVGVLSTVPWYSETSVMVGGEAYQVNAIDGTASTNSDGVTGPLVAGGLCTGTVADAVGAVVLCQRGDITFAEKILNAEASGAVGVLIYNNAEGNFFGTATDSGVTIPALTLSLADGEALLQAGLSKAATLVSAFDPNGYGYEAWNGTSMATPHVSGVAALILANAPAGTTTAQVRAAMNATAEDLGAAGRDTSYGYGLVKAAAALQCLQTNCLGGGGGGGGSGGGSGGKGGKPR